MPRDLFHAQLVREWLIARARALYPPHGLKRIREAEVREAAKRLLDYENEMRRAA